MKEKKRSKHEKYRGCVLCLEDLQHIIDLFCKYSNEVIISDPDYIYESVEELSKNYKGKINNIEICFHIPFYISLKYNFNNGPLYLYTNELNDKSSYLFDKTDQYLKQKAPLAEKVINPIYPMLLFVLFFMLKKYIKIPEDLKSSIIQGLASVFVLFAVLYVWSRIYGIFIYISTKKRESSKCFFNKKRDDIFLIIIGAIIGGIITQVFNALFK